MSGRLWRILRRVLAVARVEAFHLMRDRTTLSLVVTVPVVQLILFGYAVNPDPREIPLVIARDQAPSPILQIVQASEYFEIVEDFLPAGTARRGVEEGRALVAIELDGRGLDIIVDATDPATVRPALSALQTSYWQTIAQHAGPAPALNIQWRYNPERRTAWSIVPGLSGVVVMISMLMMGALTLVREQEAGTWESLMISPVHAIEALCGKLGPYVVLGLLQALSVVVAGRLLFDLPAPSSWGLLMAGTVLFSVGHLVFGFALSALARSQIQAVMAAVFFYLPSMLLSGFMFPFAGMPDWAKAIGNVLPLTHYINLVRGLVLKEATGESAIAQMAPMAVFALVALVLALAVYRARAND